MTTVTPNAVIGIKDDFKQFDNEYIQLVIKQASARAYGDGLDKPYGIQDADITQTVFDTAVLNYARHILMIDVFSKYNGVTSATTMGNSQTVTDKTNNDPYLAEYNRLVSLYGSSMQEKGTVVFYGD